MSGVSGGFDRALVLGGAGFIGSHLCDALLDTRTQVVCVGRRGRPPAPSPVVGLHPWAVGVQLEEGLKQTISWFTSELSASPRAVAL